MQPCLALLPQLNSQETTVTCLEYRKKSCIPINSCLVWQHTFIHQISKPTRHLHICDKWQANGWQRFLLTTIGAHTSEKSLRLLKAILGISQPSTTAETHNLYKLRLCKPGWYSLYKGQSGIFWWPLQDEHWSQVSGSNCSPKETTDLHTSELLPGYVVITAVILIRSS